MVKLRMTLVKVSPTRQQSSKHLEKYVRYVPIQKGKEVRCTRTKWFKILPKLKKIVTVLHCGKIHEPKCK